MKLPMRFRILHLISQHESITDNEVMEALRDEYGSERQFKLPVINTHLMSMRAVGMIDVADVYLNEQDNLVQKFRITDYGRGYLKYLPREWKQ